MLGLLIVLRIQLFFRHLFLLLRNCRAPRLLLVPPVPVMTPPAVMRAVPPVVPPLPRISRGPGRFLLLLSRLPRCLRRLLSGLLWLGVFFCHILSD